MACDRKTEVYSRIVGYYRPVQQWNKGKTAEYSNRKTYKFNMSSFNKFENSAKTECDQEIREAL